MKATRFFLLAALLLSFVAVLASCDMIAGLLGGDDTTGAITTTTATAATTVTTAVTLPPLASESGIKSCKLSEGVLRLTYNSGKTQSLGTVGVREGYNSAKITVVSLDSGVLTLSLLDAAGENIANRFLECAPAAVTLRLRETDGYLEWASATAEDWQVLCPARGSSSSKAMALLATAAGVGKTEPLAAGDGVLLSIKGNDLRFRATDWLRPGFDFCTDAELGRAGRNPCFMLKNYYELSSSAAPDTMGTKSADGVSSFKDASDDLAAFFFNGSYFGAGHGYSLIVKIPNTGKSEKDIGSEWVNEATGQHYYLVKVIDGMLWMCPFDEDSMKDGNFAEYSKTSKAALKTGDTLTHVTGATNTLTITVIADSTLDGNQMQFYAAVNHVEQHILLNGTHEIPLDADGVYEADFIDVYETYTVTYLPAVLNHLRRNVGKNDNESCHDEEITDAYVRFTKTLRFTRNGSSTLYQENTAMQDLDKFYSFGVISGTFTRPIYMYVPASENLASPTLHSVGESACNVLGDPCLVRDYYQMTDTAGTKAMGIGYYPFFGVATSTVRQEMTNPGNPQGNVVGQFSHITKNYPQLIKGDLLRTGESFSYIGYHSPAVPIDDDFFIINWYFVGDEVMLILNADKAVGEKAVTLPDYLDGMHVTVTQKSDTFTVTSTAIDGGITVSTTGAGYAIVRLTPTE